MSGLGPYGEQPGPEQQHEKPEQDDTKSKPYSAVSICNIRKPSMVAPLYGMMKQNKWDLHRTAQHLDAHNEQKHTMQTNFRLKHVGNNLIQATFVSA